MSELIAASQPAAPVSVPARATTEGRATKNWNGVAEGDRNNELFRKACDLRERRVPEELAAELALYLRVGTATS